MRRTFVVIFCAGLLFLTSSPDAEMLIRLHNPLADELPRELDVAGSRRGEWIDVVVEEKDIGDFAHLEVEILIEDLESFYASRKGEYHFYPDVVDHLELIATAYSDIVMLDTIGTTWEGREILALKISDNVGADEPEPEVLFVGLHHAREWPSLEICLFMIDTLTWSYGADSSITDIVNSREIWIVPCTNVDGYVYCHDLGNDWRKNRRYFADFGTYGVDLNRNYDGANNGDPLGQWGSIPGGTSHSPGSSVYCGPSPCSEPETQAIRDLILARDFVVGVSYHTYAESVMWSWGYTGAPSDDASISASVGEEMASRITRQYGGGSYDAYQSAGLYPTSGDFTDWGYGFSLYVEGKNMLAYTVEACASFHPAELYLDQVVRENFDGAFYLCEIADSMASLLTLRVMPPEITELDSSATGSYEVVWLEQNPAASPDRFQLDQLSGFSANTDGGESGNRLWVTEHFAVRDERSHAGDSAFCSNLVVGNEASAMTTIWPLPVSAQDTLSFWCWYDIEENWDYAYVEVSPNGRQWYILDEFTGNSGGWVEHAYPLDSYAGNSVFIQFRYITDDYTEREGIWVDDIRPVPSFDTAEVLDSNITDTTYTVDWVPEGHYYYRVRGHSSARGWGDWSQLEDVVATSVAESEFHAGSPARSLIGCRVNPFRSSTSIEYFVPADCEVSLDVYNLLGEHITNLRQGEVERGHHHVGWGPGSPPGVYFCRLSSPFGTETIKLISLR